MVVISSQKSLLALVAYAIIILDIRLSIPQTYIPRGLSGSVSRVAVCTGGSTVGVGVGAIENLSTLWTLAIEKTWQMKGWKLQGAMNK